MNCVGYYHALILSPTAYARHLYLTNINEDSNYWKHEDAARHMANQLMTKFPRLTVLGSPSPDLLPSDLWKDPVRITATLFSQASRIIVLVPSDCTEHIADFTTNCLGPLLSKSKIEGGKPEWHSRFVVAAIGNVTIPVQLAPEIPFVKVIRFRELAWFRDISAMILLESAIKEFWVPSITPPSSASKDQPDIGSSRIGRVYGPLVSKTGYSLDECVETTSVIGFSTHVSGKLDLPEDIPSKLTDKSNTSSPERRRSRKSRSRSSTRHSTRSRSRLLKPEFEALEAEESELKTVIRGEVGDVVPVRLNKRLQNGSTQPTLNGSEDKVANGFHNRMKTDERSPVSVDQVNGGQVIQITSDKVEDYIDDVEKAIVENPLNALRNGVVKYPTNESVEKPNNLLPPKDDVKKNEINQDGHTSPRVYRSGRGNNVRDLKAPLASTSYDDEDIHVKQDQKKQRDTTDLSEVESPRMKSQTSYVKRVVTREHTYSSYTTSERTEGRPSSTGEADQKPASSTRKRSVSPLIPTSSTIKPTREQNSPLGPSPPPPAERTSSPTPVPSAPIRVVTPTPGPSSAGTSEEVFKRQPVRIITARRINTDQTDAPVLRPSTPPKSKQFTRTISVRNLSASQPPDKGTHLAPRSMSTSNLYTESSLSPTKTATPSTSTKHVVKVYSKSASENRPDKNICDSSTEMSAPLATGKFAGKGVVCHAEQGIIYQKANSNSTRDSCTISKDECLWTGPDAGELYQLELMLNKNNIRPVRIPGHEQTLIPVQETKEIEKSIQQNQALTQTLPTTATQNVIGSSGSNLWHIMLIYLTAFLTLLLSLIIAYFIIGNSNCGLSPDPGTH